MMARTRITLFILAACGTLAAQTFLDEGFNGTALPPTWTNSGLWELNDGTNTNLNLSDFDGTVGFVVYDDDAPGSGAPQAVAVMTSPAFDSSNPNGNLLLEYDACLSVFSTPVQTLTVEVFDGTTWQQVNQWSSNMGATGSTMTQGGVSQSHDITAHANAAMQVRFTYDDAGAWGWFAAFDNVRVFVETADVDVTVGSIQPTSPIFAGTDQVLGQFHVQSLLGADVSGITISLNPASTASGTDVSNVRLYNDNGTNPGAFDGTDTLLGTAVTNLNSPASYTFTAVDVTAPGIDVLVVADLSIVPGDVVGVEVTAATDVTATQPVISATGFPVQTPSLGVFGPFVFTGNGTFVQDFEPTTQFNYEVVAAGPFFDENLTQSTTSTLGVAYIADAASAPPLSGGGTLSANSGTHQMVLDFVNGSLQVSAVDLFYDMSNLNATHTVTLNFHYVDIGSEDQAEDVILLSRDDGATWEAAIFPLPSSRPGTYTQESVDLSAIIATLPGQNYTDQMVIRFQEIDDAQSPNDGTAYDDVEIVVTGGTTGNPTASISGLTNFGSANIGVTSATSPATWTVTNTGTSDLTVSDVSSLTSEFTLGALPSFPQTVTPGNAITFEVSYTPSVIGAQTGTIRVTSNTGGTPNTNSDTAVSGSGTAANAPNLAVLGNTAFLAPGIGQSDSQVWTLTNSGLQDLVIDSIDAVSGATTDFSISGASFPLTIQNNQSANVTVTYTSSASTPANAVIRIVSNTGGVASTNTDVAVTAQTQGSGGSGFSNSPTSSSSGGDGGNCAVAPTAVDPLWGLLLLAGLAALLRKRQHA